MKRFFVFVWLLLVLICTVSAGDHDYKLHFNLNKESDMALYIGQVSVSPDSLGFVPVRNLYLSHDSLVQVFPDSHVVIIFNHREDGQYLSFVLAARDSSGNTSPESRSNALKMSDLSPPATVAGMGTTR